MVFRHFFAGLASALALGMVVVPSLARASDYTVPSGDTETATQVLTDPGDTETIDSGGAINVTGDFTDGVVSGGSQNTITNYGTVSVDGFEASGIYSTGTDVSIDNAGLIEANGQYAGGIYSAEANATIRNTGTISITGYQAGGISSAGDNAVIDNSGTITDSSDNGIGIYQTGSGVVMSNSGTIEVTGAGAAGVLAYSGDPVFTNSGRILATDPSSYAVEMYGAATLNLLAGTAIQNDFYFDDPAGSQINIGTGLNTALTFAYGFPTIDTAGQPRVIQGDLLAVVDPTGLAASNSLALDLAGSVNDALNGRAGLAAPMVPGGSGGSDVNPLGGGYWASGFGFLGSRSASAPFDGYGYGMAGVMGGFDRSLSVAVSAGLFGGVATGRVATDADTTAITATGGFFGGYWDRDSGANFARASLSGGALDDASSRIVANNKVVGGLETASATYGSYFVSPALTLGLHRSLGSAVFTPSFGVRYVSAYRGGYTETGSLADVTANGSTAEVLAVRGEARADFAPLATNAGVGRFDLRAGVDGIFTWNGAADGALLGTDLALLVSGQTSVARGYVGVGTTFTATSGLSLTGDLDASYDTTGSYAVSARASVHQAF